MEKLKSDLTIPPKDKRKIKKHRKEIEEILRGNDDRMIIITGPCSAWPSEALLEYATKLKELEKLVKDKLKIIIRVYSQKPRTTIGWLGPITQPDLFGKPDIEAGIRYVRELQLKIVSMDLPVADELLFTHKMDWVGDLLSWAAIGARSSEDQEHRVFASGLDLPVGLKNPISGDLTVGVNSVLAAQHSQVYYKDGKQVETSGNSKSHLVLRGGVNEPNYYFRHLEKVNQLVKEKEIVNPAVIVDASHDNSKYRGKKDPNRQFKVVKKVMEHRYKSERLSNLIKGVALESFIKNGSQKLSDVDSQNVDRSGVSITDPCLGWNETYKLIWNIYKEI